MASMGSDMRMRSSGPSRAGSLFKYSVACTCDVILFTSFCLLGPLSITSMDIETLTSAP